MSLSDRRLPRQPEPDAAQADDLSARALQLAGELSDRLAEGRIDSVSLEALQELTAAVCRIWSALDEAGHAVMPLPDKSRVMATDVMVFTTALLRAVDLQVFELGMWQSWTGR